MSELYKSILEKLDETQELLDKSRKNLSEIKNFVYEEMIHEPEIAVRIIYAQVYNAVHKTL